MSQDIKALEKRRQKLQIQAAKERGDLALHFEP